jgi:hypothetical protein
MNFLIIFLKFFIFIKIADMSLSDDNLYIVTAGHDDMLAIWNSTDLELIRKVKAGY